MNLFYSRLPFGKRALTVMCLDSLAVEGLSDQVSETLSTQNEGKDGHSALDSINVGLPLGSFVSRVELSHHGLVPSGLVSLVARS